MVNFTRNKFLSLPETQQQRYLALLTRSVWEGDSQSEKMYLELLSFLETTPPSDRLEDRYHHHLNRSGRQHKEFGLLVKRGDRDAPLSPKCNISVELENMRSSHNVGSIIRTAEALHLSGVYAVGTTPEPSPKTAMGAEQWVSFKRGPSPNGPFIALEITTESIPYHSFSFPSSCTLIVGNEESGCSEETLQRADCIVHIPMHGRKNSLNAANAFAIVAAEARRQIDLKESS